jgi:hypothetical protein
MTSFLWDTVIGPALEDRRLGVPSVVKKPNNQLFWLLGVLSLLSLLSVEPVSHNFSGSAFKNATFCSFPVENTRLVLNNFRFDATTSCGDILELRGTFTCCFNRITLKNGRNKEEVLIIEPNQTVYPGAYQLTEEEAGRSQYLYGPVN